MRRALLISVLGAMMAAGTASAAGSAQPPRASLESPICQQSPDSLDRLIAITAVMRPLTGTMHMELRFNLLEKPSGASSYSPVTGGDLGKWVSPSNPTLGQRPADIWKRQKQVVNLAGPALYRFHVGFRWTGSHGRTLGTEYRWGETCREP